MKNQQLICILGGLLAVSILGNLYFWNSKENMATAPASYATSTSSVIESPYGYRSEVVTVFDNGKVKTYSTTTPMTEKDVEKIQAETVERMHAMDDYFRKQEELFQDFWRAF